MSRKTTRGRKSRASSSAWWPSCATRVIWPEASRIIDSVTAASTLSSTTSTFRPAPPSAPGAGASSCGAACVAASAASGRRTVNTLPAFAPPLSAATLPPCISTRRRTSDRPMPSPPCERSTVRPIWLNISNTPASASPAIPTPVSLTTTTACSPSRRTDSRMLPRAGVYLAALLSRLATTWAMRVASASTSSGWSGISTSSACWPASISGRLVSTALARMVRRSARWRLSSSLPPLMRATSSRSSIRCTMWPTWRSIISLTLPTAAGLSPPRRITDRPLRIGASGLRSSCARVARNSVLRRSASARSSASRRSSFSERLRAETSENSSATLRLSGPPMRVA